MAAKIKGFFKTVLIGCLVFLPAIIVPLLVWWLYDGISSVINPMTVVVAKKLGLSVFPANMLVIVSLLLLFFLTGMFIKTRPGRAAQGLYEEIIKRIVPFYSVIKGVLGNIFDQKGKHLFSTPVKVRIYTEGTQFFALNGFLVDESEMENDGMVVFPENKLVTVFIPTAPNPTSGFYVDVPRAWVKRLDITSDEAIKVVLSCGAGSLALWDKK